MILALAFLLAGIGAVVVGFHMADRATGLAAWEFGAGLVAAGLVLTLGAAVGAVAVAVL